MKRNHIRQTSPFLKVGGAIIVVITATMWAYSYGLHRNDTRMSSLEAEVSVANAKVVALTPSGTGLFERTKAVVGQKFAYDNWVVSSIDQLSGDVSMVSVASPVIVTGLFFNNQESGPCLVYEQVGLESGTLPDVAGESNATFCSSDATNSLIRAKFGNVKSYSWASVEIANLRYTDHGALADITKVRAITLLEDSAGLAR